MLLLTLVLAAALALAHQHPPPPPVPSATRGHVISGMILDPGKRLPADALLVLVTAQDAAASASEPVRVAPDGSFITRRVPPGTCLLELVRRSTSPLERNRLFGLQVVRMGDADLAGATVLVRREVTIQGTFRMETGDPSAAEPVRISVSALLVVDGQAIPDGIGAEREPGGTFFLHNAFGPRILRVGYQLAPGRHWWPSRVLLDGRDITNVPTELSEEPGGRLEMVFTGRPSWLAGRVLDGGGRPVAGAWVVEFADDQSLWHWWASTSDAVQTDSRGAFRIAVRPGRYLLRALPRNAFSYRSEALRDVSRFAVGAVPVEVTEHLSTHTSLTIPEP